MEKHHSSFEEKKMGTMLKKQSVFVTGKNKLLFPHVLKNEQNQLFQMFGFTLKKVLLYSVCSLLLAPNISNCQYIGSGRTKASV